MQKRRQVKTSFYIRYTGKRDDVDYRLTVTSDKWLTDYKDSVPVHLEDFGI